MSEASLLFVDGIPGSGKSTTAQLVAFRYQRMGIPARWFYEHQNPHPIYAARAMELARRTGGPDADAMFARALGRWDQLSSRVGRIAGIHIFDGTLFQSTVGTLCLMDRAREEILQYMLEVVRRIEAVRPALVYFHQPDVEKALRSTCQRRGSWFADVMLEQIANTPYGRRQQVRDFAGVLQFFRWYRTLMDELVSTLPLRVLAIENSANDWTEYCRRIAKFLGLADLAEPEWEGIDGPDVFAGCYQGKNSEETFVLAADRGGLIIDDPSRTKLFPVGQDRFAMQGLCVEFTFTRDAQGQVIGLRMAGSLAKITPTWRKRRSHIHAPIHF